MAAKSKRIVVQEPEIGEARVTVKRLEISNGLITNRLGAKVRDSLRAQGVKGISRKRGPRDPEASFRDALYVIDAENPGVRYGDLADNPKFDSSKHKYGFPANAFKAAMVRACKQVDGATMKDAKIFFFVHGEYGDLVEVRTPQDPWMREDVVRLNTPGNPPDLRYRPQFDEWEAVLRITYDREVFDLDGIVQLVSRAGRIGVGERRPEREGNTYGMFRVQKVEEVVG